MTYRSEEDKETIKAYILNSCKTFDPGFGTLFIFS